MRSLADEETREILFECTSVWVSFLSSSTPPNCAALTYLPPLPYQVAPDDQLPQKMCAKCWNQCKSWSDFKALAQDSERQLGLVIKKEVEDEVMDNGNEVNVKEEPLEYLNGYSLAPEDQEEEIEDREQEPSEIVHNNRHKFVHTNDEPFPSAECEQKITSATKKVRGPKREIFKCDQCERKFSSICHLRLHRMSHSGIKPFKCDQCEKTFVNRSYLAIHIQSHSLTKPFECAQCDHKFKYQKTLDRHIREKH